MRLFCRNNFHFGKYFSRFSVLYLWITLLEFCELASFSLLQPECQDLNENCRHWVASDSDQCVVADYIKQSCLRSCGVCMTLPAKYDVKNLPDRLKPIEWMVGIWRSEGGGKAIFPTIPTFTYGEQVEISIADPGKGAKIPSLNYTAFAWSMDKKRVELHSENGFITISEDDDTVALTTVMSNGFVTVEEGPITRNRIRFRLVDIGRISFSRDLPVHDLIREWSLLDRNTLEARLLMGTLTHGLREHTTVIYTKIFP